MPSVRIRAMKPLRDFCQAYRWETRDALASKCGNRLVNLRLGHRKAGEPVGVCVVIDQLSESSDIGINLCRRECWRV